MNQQLEFPLPIDALRAFSILPYDYRKSDSLKKRKKSLRRAIDENRLRNSMIKTAKADGIYKPKVPNNTKPDIAPPTDQNRRETILRMAVDGVTSKEYQKASGQSGQRASHHLHTQKAAGLIEIIGKTPATTATRTRGVNIYKITKVGLKMLDDVYGG